MRFLLREVSKRKAYARHLEERGVHIVGIQEARSPKDVIGKVGPFIRVATAADAAGAYGCEMWVNTQLPFAYRHGKPIHVKRDDITPVVMTPRLLLVRLLSSVVDAYICVAHAPWHGSDGCADWWNDFKIALCKHVKPNAAVIVCADPNMQLAEQHEPAVGSLGVCRDSEHVHMLIDACTKCSLSVPSTFPEMVVDLSTGSQHTFLPRAGG